MELTLAVSGVRVRACENMGPVAQFSFIPSTDASDFADDIRRLFDELAAHLRQDPRAYSGECRPALDVLETDRQVEIIVDLAGIPPAAIRVAFRDDVLLIVGEKASPKGSQGHAYHLVEREFGRFARAIRLSGAFDVAAARATLRDGELSIVLSRIDERRGRTHLIPVHDETPRGA